MNRARTTIYRLISLLTMLVLLGGFCIEPYQQQVMESVIVQAGSAAEAAALVERFGGEVTSELEIIQGVGAKIPSGALAALNSVAGVSVFENATTQLTEHEFDAVEKGKKPSNPATDFPDVTGADLAWEQGELGDGIGVAVIDTGIAMHPSLMKSPSGKTRSPVIGWVDFVEGKRMPVDPNGHGTHIAGIIADASKGADGEYNGMAPAARLIGVRVLDRKGAGDYEKVIRGIQWVIKYKNRYNIKVMNLSLHSLVQSPYWADPLNQAVMRAWAAGITVVVAAGNDGPNPMTIAVPGNTPYVVTVGAFTDNYTPEDWNDDYIAEFASAGPTLDGFVKPDLMAPGAHITSTMMPGSYIARRHNSNWVSSLYFSMAGTSQSAAVVSGAAALVLSQHPDLSPDQVKYRLMYTSLPWVNPEQTDVLYSVWQQGFGRVNAYDAVYGEGMDESANWGMDVQADLDGQHYEGYSYYDEATGTFKLRGYEDMTSGFGSWAGGFGSWAGGFGSWAGGFGSWAGGFGSWAGGFGSWAGGFGSWAGGFGSWAGGFGSWAGGFGSWAGGFGSWAGGFGSWAGGFGVWAGQLSDPTFVENYINGVAPDLDSSAASVHWVEEE